MQIHEKKGIFAILVVVFGLTCSYHLRAQTPTPSPGGDFEVKSTIEIGVRGLSVNGDHEKFRSDLNYRPGLRIFDSSFLIQDNRSRMFDSVLMQASGWGADPSGIFRANVDKSGAYKFDANVRRVLYFNDLKNHAVNWAQLVPTGSEHKFNTVHNFSDFDLTLFPESNFRIRAGLSFNNTQGPGAANVRFDRDEFQVDSNFDNNSHDVRFGVEGKVLGFNMGLNYGHREFRDRTRFFEDSPNPGNDIGATTSSITSMYRQFNVDGKTDWGHFFVQRTFARKFDFTGRLIYSHSTSDFTETDLLSGRSRTVSGTFFNITANEITVPGSAKRPQTRADVGLTYRPSDRFRISNTFTFDQFNVGGVNTLLDIQRRTTAAGAPASDVISNTFSLRTTSYRKFSDLIEADFQANRRVAFNLGYRFTHRRVTPAVYDVNLITGVPATYNTPGEPHENQTHSFIAGTKLKPTDNWSIYADLEKGESDSVFTRLANNEFFNFRVRSIANFNRFTFNASFITKDNDSPGTSEPVTSQGGFPATETIATTKIRIFSATVDWTPATEFSLSAGYTYNYQDGFADIIVPVGAPLLPSTTWLLGVSEYYVRDSFFHIDVSARPTKRVSFYGSYRFNNDDGQGNRVITRPQDFITSYPMRSHVPEFRVAVRLTDNIDWNIGYQYYSYRETPFHNPFASINPSGTVVPQQIPAQNYNAHMPYTSLRIYFGRSADR